MPSPRRRHGPLGSRLRGNDACATVNILIVKLSSLGDVVHAMPAVQDVRTSIPGANVDWVVERGFAPLVQRCDGVRRAIAKISSGSSEPSMWMCSSALGMRRSSSGRRSVGTVGMECMAFSCDTDIRMLPQPWPRGATWQRGPP